MLSPSLCCELPRSAAESLYLCRCWCWVLAAVQLHRSAAESLCLCRIWCWVQAYVVSYFAVSQSRYFSAEFVRKCDLHFYGCTWKSLCWHIMVTILQNFYANLLTMKMKEMPTTFSSRWIAFKQVVWTMDANRKFVAVVSQASCIGRFRGLWCALAFLSVAVLSVQNGHCSELTVLHLYNGH